MKKLPLIALMALALPVAAQAQDADASENNFAGTYAGITGARKNITTHVAGNELKAKGWAPTLVLGYNAPIGEHFILGGEANFTDVFGKKANFTDAAGKKYSSDPKFGFGASAHAGVLVMPQVMAYGLVGWQRQKADLLTTTPAVGTTAATSVKSSQKISGMSYGGGLEFAMTSSSFLRAEYRYDDGKGKDHSNAISIGLGVRF